MTNKPELFESWVVEFVVYIQSLEDAAYERGHADGKKEGYNLGWRCADHSKPPTGADE